MSSAKGPSCVNGVPAGLSEGGSAMGEGAGDGVGVGVGSGVITCVAVAGAAVALAAGVGAGVPVAVGTGFWVGAVVGVKVKDGKGVSVTSAVALGESVGVAVISTGGGSTVGCAGAVAPPEFPASQMVANARLGGPVAPSLQTHASTSPFFKVRTAAPSPEYSQAPSPLPV